MIVRTVAAWMLAACLSAGIMAGEARPPARTANQDEGRLAVVNVSLVFENYKKVPDVQRRVDEIFRATKNELDQRSRALAERNRQLEQTYGSATPDSEQVFDAVQSLRKDYYLYQRDVRKLNAEIEKAYSKEMRDVLADIRAAVRTIAEQRRFRLVLRSPDSDDPKVIESDPNVPMNPAAGDQQTHLALKAPRDAAEVVERFHRNPVLFGAETVDITQDVLNKLNQDYGKKTGK